MPNAHQFKIKPRRKSQRIRPQLTILTNTRQIQKAVLFTSGEMNRLFMSLSASLPAHLLHFLFVSMICSIRKGADTRSPREADLTGGGGNGGGGGGNGGGDGGGDGGDGGGCGVIYRCYVNVTLTASSIHRSFQSLSLFSCSLPRCLQPCSVNTNPPIYQTERLEYFGFNCSAPVILLGCDSFRSFPTSKHGIILLLSFSLSLSPAIDIERVSVQNSAQTT